MSIYIEPRDSWIGVFDRDDALYILLAPFVVLRWTGWPLTAAAALYCISILTIPFYQWITFWPNRYLTAFSILVSIQGLRRLQRARRLRRMRL